jgi:hypothetical protein
MLCVEALKYSLRRYFSLIVYYKDIVYVSIIIYDFFVEEFVERESHGRNGRHFVRRFPGSGRSSF